MERIIEVISKDKRYRQTPYPSKPAIHSTWNVFLTGQHVVPGDNARRDYLTTDEMRDTTKLSAAKAKKFPAISVINPDNVQIIAHRRKLNLTPIEEANAESPYPGDYLYPHDKAFYEYLLEREFVARSEDEYVGSKHFFYLLDKEAAAVKRLSKRDLKFEAEAYIRNEVNVSAYRDVALFLNHRIKNFNIAVDVSTDTQIKDKLFEAVDKHPDIVLEFNPKTNAMVGKELFILRLINQNLIEQRNGAYYDGPKWLGSTVQQVIETFTKDEAINAKFVRMMEGKSTGKITS